MDLSDNTVLVTGGGSGIGLAIAERFLDAGSQVIICGRRADKLTEARAVHPKLEIRIADVADATGREDLIAWMIAEYPDFTARRSLCRVCKVDEIKCVDSTELRNQNFRSGCMN